MHTVITDFKRPAKTLIEAVSKQHVGVAGFEAGPRQVAHPAIKPLDPAWRICGPAFTVRPEDWDDRLMAEVAPKHAKPGDVLVIDAGGYTQTAVWGMSMSQAANAAGVAGVVIDGSCMNARLHTHERPQIPLFTRGVSPIAKGAQRPGSLNVPVICGGVIVNPGDIVLADADGVVFLPPRMAQKIIDACEAHDVQARQDSADGVPFHKRKSSEDTLRALPDIEWL